MGRPNHHIVIEARNLSIGYRHGRKQVHTIQQGLNFQLYSGELTCLLGSNGIGKSTLLRTLSAFQPPLSGDLLIEKRPLHTLTEKERSRLISVVLTDKTQSGGLTVTELVALGRQPHTGFFGHLQSHDKELIQEAVQQVGIASKANCYMAELSDGERQKAMIAKALVQESPLILLDEPTAFLDVVSRIEIMTLLHRLATKTGKAILLSTHDIEQALVLADRLWLLTGNGITCGLTEDLILNNQMDSLFGLQNIRFDSTHGVYYPLVEAGKRIDVQVSDEILLHWVINALNRNGFTCHIITNKTENQASTPYLKVISASELHLSYEGNLQLFSSFEELINFLQLI